MAALSILFVTCIKILAIGFFGFGIFASMAKRACHKNAVDDYSRVLQRIADAKRSR